MKWHLASSVRQFWSLDQAFTPDQVAESCRTRRVKDGIGSLTRVSAAFDEDGPIHLKNPGSKGSMGARNPIQPSRPIVS
jgi:hypothetical protein